MRRPTRKVFRGAFNALMLGALGFGATQALASPAAPAAVVGCSKLEASECLWGCKEQFGSNYGGVCNKNVWGHVTCQCVELVPPSGS